MVEGDDDPKARATDALLELMGLGGRNRDLSDHDLDVLRRRAERAGASTTIKVPGETIVRLIDEIRRRRKPKSQPPQE